MKKFYSISTSEFRPISHENVYLYGEYNKIKNFLVSNNQEELLKVLSIPSFKNNQIDWSALTNNDIKKLDQFPKIQQDKILSQYHQFLNSYNNFIKVLRSSKHQDKKNWGELLHSLIEGSANELFYDGENIFITWGWRLLDENSKKLIPVYNPNISKVENEPSAIEEEIVEPEPIPVIKEDINEEVIDEELEEEQLSWLDRLYLFINKLWWLIPTLSFIILILLLFRSCTDDSCVKLNDKIDNLNNVLENCECKEVVVRGCIDDGYKEYNPDANVDDGSCKTKLVPCNVSTKSGGPGVTKTNHSLGQNSGKVTIRYDMLSVPDKLEVFYEGKRVSSTFDVRGNENGYVGGRNRAGCCGKISFNYSAGGDSFCTVVVTGLQGTSWNYTLGCPK